MGVRAATPLLQEKTGLAFCKTAYSCLAKYHSVKGKEMETLKCLILSLISHLNLLNEKCVKLPIFASSFLTKSSYHVGIPLSLFRINMLSLCYN